MPISVVLAIVLGVLFVATYWAAVSGYFDAAVTQATGLSEAIS